MQRACREKSSYQRVPMPIGASPAMRSRFMRDALAPPLLRIAGSPLPSSWKARLAEHTEGPVIPGVDPY